MPREDLLGRRPARRVGRERGARLRAVMAVPVLPTLLTLGNAICGLGSITLAAQAPATDPYPLYAASLLIFIAMLFDMLDGAVARWARQCSAFGMQLDSLCDVVSFGVAPAFLLLQQASQAYNPRVLWAIAALYLACSVLRLARFNVETDASSSHAWFCGLPTPGAAAMIASVTMVLANEQFDAIPHGTRGLLARPSALTEALRMVLPLLAVGVSMLMVSRIRFPHVAVQSLRRSRRFPQLVKLVFAIAAVLAVGELAIPLIILAYVASGPTRAAWQFLLPRRVDANTPVPEAPVLPTEVNGPQSGCAKARTRTSRHRLGHRPP